MTQNQKQIEMSLRSENSQSPSYFPQNLMSKDLSSPRIPNHKILLYVCQPKFQGKKVFVLPTEPIYLLNSLFPGEKKDIFS